MFIEWKEKKTNKDILTHNDIIRYLMLENVNMTVLEIRHFFNSFLKCLEEGICQGKNIRLTRFGTFYPDIVFFNSFGKTGAKRTKHHIVRFRPSAKVKKKITENAKLIEERYNRLVLLSEKKSIRTKNAINNNN